MALKKIPKGKLLIIGGAEDKGDSERPDISSKNTDFKDEEILKRLLPPPRSKRTVEIITTASTESDDIVKMYQKAFRKLNFTNLRFINIGTKEEAGDPRWLGRIEKAHTVLFSGGDQFRLAAILGNTPILKTILRRYTEENDFVVAGTSAGAMAACTLMMCEGENNEAMLKGTVKLSSGLGFIDGCLVDTHFIKRGRFGRLAQAVVMNPTCVGIGLGEDTALMIEKGRLATCIGSGMVVIIDGQPIGHTNIAYAEERQAVCVEKMTVHILCEGTSFELEKREFRPSAKDLKLQKDMN